MIAYDRFLPAILKLLAQSPDGATGAQIGMHVYKNCVNDGSNRIPSALYAYLRTLYVAMVIETDPARAGENDLDYRESTFKITDAGRAKLEKLLD